MNDRVARLFIERVLQPVDLGCLLLSARCDISGQRTTVGMGRLSSASLASDTRSRSSGGRVHGGGAAWMHRHCAGARPALVWQPQGALVSFVLKDFYSLRSAFAS